MTKHWLDSTTVRGSLLSLVPSLLVVFGLLNINIGGEELKAIIEVIAAFAGLVGGCVAIYGRFVAKGDITF